MRVLITGITGFAGSHLAEYILANHPDVAVYGTVRWRSRMENLEALVTRGVVDVIEGRYSAGAGQSDEAHKGRVTLLYCDLTDAGAVEKLIATVRPERIFNHAGPRRGHVFSTGTFARQIALIEAGKHEPVIYVGDLTSKRDFTDVRDVVRAYWLALEKAEAGEVYNVGRGRTWSMGEMLNILLSHSKVKIRTQEDPARLRPSDVPILWSDSSKFHAATGWEPKIPFEDTLRDELDHWRELVRRESMGVVMHA